MDDELKNILQEMRDAMDEVNEICCFEEYDPNKPTSCCLDSDALEGALKKEKEAKIKYHTLLFQRRGWTQEKIDEALKRLRLK